MHGTTAMQPDSDRSREIAHDVLGSLLEGLDKGSIDVIDLTHALSERTPVIELPEPFRNTPGFKVEPLSRYDDDGPRWYWNAIQSAEHVGTHFDAPIHWITGRDREDVAAVPPAKLIAPAVVLDRTSQVAQDPGYLVEREDVRDFEDRYGPLPEGGWLLVRTGWEARHDDRQAFLGTDDAGSQWPGVSPDCARWLAEETPILGLGVETVGIDAGMAARFDPIFPAHHFLMGAGKYGLASLRNLAKLPPTGTVIVCAPQKIAGGSGSSARVLALVPRDAA